MERTVLVAMSGGVDSLTAVRKEMFVTRAPSVTALESGIMYLITGLYFRNAFLNILWTAI